MDVVKGDVHVSRTAQPPSGCRPSPESHARRAPRECSATMYAYDQPSPSLVRLATRRPTSQQFRPAHAARFSQCHDSRTVPVSGRRATIGREYRKYKRAASRKRACPDPVPPTCARRVGQRLGSKGGGRCRGAAVSSQSRELSAASVGRMHDRCGFSHAFSRDRSCHAKVAFQRVGWLAGPVGGDWAQGDCGVGARMRKEGDTGSWRRGELCAVAAGSSAARSAYPPLFPRLNFCN